MLEKSVDVDDDYDLRALPVVVPVPAHRPFFRKEIIDGLDEYFSLEAHYLDYLATHEAREDLLDYVQVQGAPLRFLERRPDIAALLQALRKGDIKLVLRAAA